MPTNVTVRKLTPDLWPAFEDLFGSQGAASRCWCMYWRIGADYRKRATEHNRAALRKLVDDGPPPGLVAFAGDVVVGWCQVTPRHEIPAIDRMWRLKPVDDLPVWSISCLYVRKSFRKQGITAALIMEAVEVARRAGAPAIEAYPFDAEVSPSATGTGFASTFERAGFATITRRIPARPIMRLVLTPPGSSHPPR